MKSSTDCASSGAICSKAGGAHCDRPPRGYLDTLTCETISGTGGNDAELTESPKTLLCAPPALPGPPATLRRALDDASFSARSFSSFFDVAPMPDALARVSTWSAAHGPSLPSEPARAVADDGSPDVWLLDTDTRRHVVNAASMSAWRFPTLKTWVAAELSEIPRGRDVPALPLLLRALGPELDAAFQPATLEAAGGASGATPSSGGTTAAVGRVGMRGTGGGSVNTDRATVETSGACATANDRPASGAWLLLSRFALLARRARRRRHYFVT